jgi:cyanobactin maturation PatA/PatG family protease
MPGLEALWRRTPGDPLIPVAILDGPVDRSHPSLASGILSEIETVVPGAASRGLACRHGTHVASIIFGQHTSPVRGIAPRNRGVIAPVFADGAGGEVVPCSQLDLARAVFQAIQAGCRVINISGGEYIRPGAAHPLLLQAIDACAERGILVVAAAGNDGCACLHVPGGLPSVLAVGAMDDLGRPLPSSNWGGAYRTSGILAPGQNILGAVPGGGVAAQTGTSYSTAVVSGVAALLMSLQRVLGRNVNAAVVRSALLRSAVGCADPLEPACDRLLAGRLNIEGAMSLILNESAYNGGRQATDQPAAFQIDLAPPPAPPLRAGVLPASEAADGEPPAPEPRAPDPIAPEGAVPAAARPSASTGGCGCGGAASVPASLVFALGQLGFDFGSEARRDSISQHIGANAADPLQLLAYLETNPSESESIIWTLNLDATPIYAIAPLGAFSSEVYSRLRGFLREQIDEGVERVSVGGALSGKAVLMSGQALPVIRPALRCLNNWTVQALAGAASKPAAKAAKPQHPPADESLKGFLERVYHELRNLGLAPEHRAINYAATNAFTAARIFQQAANARLALDSISVERSPLCRPGSDCWDVKLSFFDPENVLRARRIFRYTVDVSDVCPVTVGDVRSWPAR